MDSKLHFKRLRTSENDRYVKAMEGYRSSFPVHEQREPASQDHIMGNADYHFNLIYDGDMWVGLFLCWETERFIYVEHFCILPEMRNRQYGQRALELLNGRGKTIILEIDPPADEISRRRKAFYERAGYRENGFAHVHPPYHNGLEGHSLVVMSCPKELSEEEYRAFNQYLGDTVMGI